MSLHLKVAKIQGEMSGQGVNELAPPVGAVVPILIVPSANEFFPDVDVSFPFRIVQPFQEQPPNSPLKVPK
jgi:hypothetical protein